MQVLLQRNAGPLLGLVRQLGAVRMVTSVRAVRGIFTVRRTVGAKGAKIS